MKIEGSISGIGPKSNLVVAGERHEVSLGDIEEGTDELDPGIGGGRVLPFHSGDAFAAGAAEEAEEKKFDLIIGVMGEGDGGDAQAGGGVSEKLVTKFAGGHLDGEAAFFGE